MPRFAANLSTLFTEYPLIERFSKAAQCGFTHIEIQFPYSLEIRQLQDALTHNHLQAVLINIPAGNWARGDRGMACDPKRTSEFRKGVHLCAKYAHQLNIKLVNCLSGKLPANVDAKTAESTLIENLRYAESYLKEYGITLVIEPINTIDIPDFFLHSTQQAVDIIKACGSDSSIRVQSDIYHMQMMGEDPIDTLTKLQQWIAHIQVADVPGRHEPGTGEIPFDTVFSAIDQMGYKGFVSFEYFPEKTTEIGLSHLAQWHLH